MARVATAKADTARAATDTTTAPILLRRNPTGSDTVQRLVQSVQPAGVLRAERLLRAARLSAAGLLPTAAVPRLVLTSLAPAGALSRTSSRAPARHSAGPGGAPARTHCRQSG